MMNDSGRNEQDAGLCARCQYAQIIRNNRGSTFYLCRLSATDPRFPKYPRLPVLTCAGFTPSPKNPE
jgi:hypothetical protein